MLNIHAEFHENRTFIFQEITSAGRHVNDLANERNNRTDYTIPGGDNKYFC